MDCCKEKKYQLYLKTFNEPFLKYELKLDELQIQAIKKLFEFKSSVQVLQGSKDEIFKYTRILAENHINFEIK